jgi:lipid-binding SYLF domain-containing protein
MKIRKSLILALVIGLLSTFALAEDEPSEQVKRLDASAAVLDEIMGTPDKGIPEEILGSAECVAVVPSMVKIGFIFGEKLQ